MPKLVDLTGTRIGWLRVINRNTDNPSGPVMWNCVCDCGTELVRAAKWIRGPGVASCGCYNIALSTERFSKHGLARSVEYRIWQGMKSRCYSPSNAAYYKYGARGIGVCERWMNVENFISDMGPRPSPKHSLDRIDGTKDYSPENCRWATPEQQQRNIKTNVFLEYDGKSMIAADWAKIVGIDAKTIQSRIQKLGWTAEEALTLPLNFHHKHKRP